MLIQSNNDIVLAGYTATANGTFTSPAATPRAARWTPPSATAATRSRIRRREGAAALYPAVARRLPVISSRPWATKWSASPPTAALTLPSARTGWRRCPGPARSAASLFSPTARSSERHRRHDRFDVEVTRLNVNGSVDTTFGTKGTWTDEYSDPLRRGRTQNWRSKQWRTMACGTTELSEPGSGWILFDSLRAAPWTRPSTPRSRLSARRTTNPTALPTLGP